MRRWAETQIAIETGELNEARRLISELDTDYLWVKQRDAELLAEMIQEELDGRSGDDNYPREAMNNNREEKEDGR